MRTRIPMIAAGLTAGLLAAPLLAQAQTAAPPASTMPQPGTGATATPPMAMPLAKTVAPIAASTNERVSKIIGASVYNELGDVIGTVDDVLLTGQGAAPTAVLSVGGFLGIGSRLVTVPLAELRYTQDNSRWTLAGATKESLTARSAFSYDGRG